MRKEAAGGLRVFAILKRIGEQGEEEKTHGDERTWLCMTRRRETLACLLIFDAYFEEELMKGTSAAISFYML